MCTASLILYMYVYVLIFLSIYLLCMVILCQNSDRYPHVPVDPDDLPIRPGLKPPYPYKTVGCIFNHEYFFANAQVFGLLLSISFLLFFIYCLSAVKNSRFESILVSLIIL